MPAYAFSFVPYSSRHSVVLVIRRGASLFVRKPKIHPELRVNEPGETFGYRDAIEFVHVFLVKRYELLVLVDPRRRNRFG